MPSIETILSPALIPYHNLQHRTAVIIDVLRATTSICYALSEGALSMIPVSNPVDCLMYRNEGYLCAGERNGIKLDGFDMGNSPEEFQSATVAGKKIAITTTNGTHAILESKEADRIYIGSFSNLKALAKRLTAEGNDVTLVCAGWKNRVNLEDTLFAGALASALEGFTSECDSTLMAKNLWDLSKEHLQDHVEQSSHAQRFIKLGVDDMRDCLNLNQCDNIPEYLNGEIVNTVV